MRENDMHEARLYTRHEGVIHCELCAHECKIRDGKRGLCNVRENRGGKLYTLVYGKLIAEHVDPIEKKPLFHVFPGSTSYSIATRGCNFHCRHCQNSSISQVAMGDDPTRFCLTRSPQEVVDAALKAECKTISYTYVEPTIFFEFAYDCCQLAADNGIYNIFVSNGYMTGRTARVIAPFLTAINIDIKSFRDEFYRKVCGARLQPVLDTVKLMRELGVWVEVTTLVIPDYNDSVDELNDIAKFLVEVDATIPWHVTAFSPSYKMLEEKHTPKRTLLKAQEIGFEAGLQQVYVGNILSKGGEDTICPSCGTVVVSRLGFSIQGKSMIDGRCLECSAVIPGVW
ncbi:AmmeMemoRadiSam system radical SAM enzyme [Desulfosediminicola sp.]|uniref:AmmeMemoRadiSam system radical SAM enzyme n=1 Tax=Desulfosediminicola sp. TaxID=2886825 RepID=UPI003AF304F5